MLSTCKLREIQQLFSFLSKKIFTNLYLLRNSRSSKCLDLFEKFSGSNIYKLLLVRYVEYILEFPQNLKLNELQIPNSEQKEKLQLRTFNFTFQRIDFTSPESRF